MFQVEAIIRFSITDDTYANMFKQIEEWKETMSEIHYQANFDDGMQWDGELQIVRVTHVEEEE